METDLGRYARGRSADASKVWSRPATATGRKTAAVSIS